MLSDDEIHSALFASGLHHVNRTVITRWKDGIDLDFPVWEVVAFARAVEQAAYAAAIKACEEIENGSYKGCTTSGVAWECADAIRSLMEQPK